MSHQSPDGTGGATPSWDGKPCPPSPCPFPLFSAKERVLFPDAPVGFFPALPSSVEAPGLQRPTAREADGVPCHLLHQGRAGQMQGVVGSVSLRPHGPGTLCRGSDEVSSCFF